MTEPVAKTSDACEEHGLIRRAIAGDEDAGAALVRRLMPVIRARVRCVLSQQGKALGPGTGDDLIQEIWLRLIEEGGRRLLTYDPERGATLEGYVGLLASREIGNRMTKAAAKKRGGHLVMLEPERAEGVASPEARPDELAEVRELAARLGEHLDRELPARGQLVLRYAFTDEIPAPQVAALLGVTVQVVYNWQHKIRAAARAFLSSR